MLQKTSPVKAFHVFILFCLGNIAHGNRKQVASNASAIMEPSDKLRRNDHCRQQSTEVIRVLSIQNGLKIERNKMSTHHTQSHTHTHIE